MLKSQGEMVGYYHVSLEWEVKCWTWYLIHLSLKDFNYAFLFLLATVVTSLSEFKQVGENSIMMAVLMLSEVSIVR
ncbi:hypothetical protein PRUPE_2G097000 [Prunus persica]|uniref:Uncharacterized protein n=1 Tax=Prunus persica TaxID=3760 RepID=A0A251QDP6_PRUPE|nr:hypothetical protein PRUPE_2G097000 [Prunus persica]